MSDLDQNNQVIISVYQSLTDSKQGTRGYRMLSDYFQSLDDVPTLLNLLADKQILSEPSVSTSLKLDLKVPSAPLMSPAGVWTDSTGGQLYGWAYTSSNGGFYWGNGYTDYLTSASYFQTLRVRTYNDCGYWHQISDSNVITEYYKSGATQVTVLLGSNQCGSLFQTVSNHSSQRYPSVSTYVSGTTSATCTGSDC
ncbi:hypothetical protein MNBD_CHLOROFLEXI01-5378 [hydrothermal vent metagenome]|uniref:Uncharacterized protein n=1 Tax=hydrothermal vent metagenome TaxID=652676 RepID=A0A3B0UR29_9ZZZZ